MTYMTEATDIEEAINKELVQKAEFLNIEGKPSSTIDPARLKASLENAQATGVLPPQPDIKKEKQIATFNKILDEKERLDKILPTPTTSPVITGNQVGINAFSGSPQPLATEKKSFFSKIAGWFKKAV